MNAAIAGASEKLDALRSRLPAHPATILAGAAMVVSGALLLRWMSRLTFWRDEWDFLLHREGWSLDTFLQPFAEQLLAIPILSYRTLQTAFGMDDPLPYQIVSVALFLLSVAMVFIYMRRRLGEWLALAAVLPILFLGPSWDDLLFPFQMALFGSVSSGVAALLLLERRDRAGDVGAAVLLFLSLFFFDLGICFVAAATIELAFGRDRWRRAYVVAVPTAIWLLWYAIWGHEAHTFISFGNFARSPSYMLDGLAASLATWVGLGTEAYDTTKLDWGRPLLVLALGLGALRLYTMRRFSPRLVATAVLLFGFWFLVALNTNPLAPATAGRYQYLGIVLMALFVAELAAGLRARWYAVALIVLAAVMAATTNGVRLRDAAIGLAGVAEQQRGGLAALELARDEVDPDFLLTQENSGVDYLGWLDAGSYLDAVDQYDSPAYSPSGLASAPDNARTSADTVSAAALGVGFQPAGAGFEACRRLDLRGGPAVIELPPEGIVLESARTGTDASLRRYATGSFPVSLGALEPRSPVLLRTPPDRSTLPWTLELAGGGPVTACRASP